MQVNTATTSSKAATTSSKSATKSSKSATTSSKAATSSSNMGDFSAISPQGGNDYDRHCTITEGGWGKLF
jgi:hypothetical protein